MESVLMKNVGSRPTHFQSERLETSCVCTSPWTGKSMAKQHHQQFWKG